MYWYNIFVTVLGMFYVHILIYKHIKNITGEERKISSLALACLLAFLVLLRWGAFFLASHMGLSLLFMPMLFKFFTVAAMFIICKGVFKTSTHLTVSSTCGCLTYMLMWEYAGTVVLVPIAGAYIATWASTYVTSLEPMVVPISLQVGFIMAKHPRIKKYLTITEAMLNPISTTLATFTVVATLFISLMLHGVVGNLSILLELIAILLAVCFCAFSLFLQYSTHNMYNHLKHKIMLQEQTTMQQNYIAKITTNSQRVKIQDHNFRANLNNLYALAQENKIPQLLESIESLGGEARPTIYDTGNIMFDAVISDKEETARTQGIDITINLSLPNALPALTLPICTMVSNALDNAIEASKNAPTKTIELEVTAQGQMLMLRIRNTYHTIPILKNGTLQTQKANPKDHGLGLISMANTVTQAGGHLDYHWDSKHFMLHICLPL